MAKQPNSESSEPVAGAPKAQLKKLAKLDQEIVTKVNERAQLAQQIGATAAEGPLNLAFEEQQIASAVESSRGPLSESSVRNVLREIASGCRSLVRPLRVAYLGPEYTYSHVAAIHRFGNSAELAPVATIAAVFEEVARRQVDYGLVPVENSTDGRVTDTLDMFAKVSVRICGEVQLRIHHNLLGLGSRNDIREVYSKPQALSQCRNWLARHLPHAQIIEIGSTAEAARLAREKPGTAAVANLQAATNYQLQVLAPNIEDNPENVTRFAIIGQAGAARTGDDKTAMLFEVQHRPGALADAMNLFKRAKLNLTWIESFPIPGNAGRYLFFVEFHGHQSDLRVRRAIAALGKKALRMEVLGSYARAEVVG